MSTTVKWGLITGLVYIVFSLIGNVTGIQQAGGGGSMGLGFLLNILIMVATFFTIYMGVKETRDEVLGGYLTMGDALKSGMKIALIAGIALAVYSLLYATVIDPHMMDKAMEAAEEKWDEMGMSEEQREMSRKWAGMFMNPYILAPFLICWVAFWGLLKSLVAGAMLKKEPPPVVPPSIP